MKLDVVKLPLVKVKSSIPLMINKIVFSYTFIVCFNLQILKRETIISY